MPETVVIPVLPVLFVLAVVVMIVGVYLWSRKAAKHPEYAAKLEAKADASAEDVAAWLEAKGLTDSAATVRKLKDYDLVKAGQLAYQTIEPRLNSLEAKLNELLGRVPKP